MACAAMLTAASDVQDTAGTSLVEHSYIQAGTVNDDASESNICGACTVL